ncbi:MAG: IS630 family transposase, partial [Nostoc sp.]
MINQHLQTATLKTEVGTAIAIAELQDFIAACGDARQARKAMAVKLIYQDYLYEEI